MIREAGPKDLASINDIYNQAVEDGLRTAHCESISLAEREGWFLDHQESNYPIFLYEENNKTLGWLSISPYRSDRQALNEVVEISYYVDYGHHNEGIATTLMQHAIDFCRKANYRILLAILVSGNQPSISLLQKFGFQEVGRIPDAIHYKDVFRDHLYMCKRLDVD